MYAHARMCAQTCLCTLVCARGNIWLQMQRRTDDECLIVPCLKISKHVTQLCIGNKRVLLRYIFENCAYLSAHLRAYESPCAHIQYMSMYACTMYVLSCAHVMICGYTCICAYVPLCRCARIHA